MPLIDSMLALGGAAELYPPLGAAGADAVVVTAAAATPQIVIEAETEDEAPVEFPSAGIIESLGAGFGLTVLRRHVRHVTESSDSQRLWGRVSDHAAGPGVEALALLSEGLSPGQESTELTAYATELSFVIRARWAATTLPNWLGANLEVEQARTSQPNDRVRVPYPLLSWSSEALSWISVKTKTILDDAALILRGPWLCFASLERLKEIAEEDPGEFLGDLAGLRDSLSKIQFEAKLSGRQRNMLQAFFTE